MSPRGVGRPRPSAAVSAAPAFLALAIVAILAGGAAAIAVHHTAKSTATASSSSTSTTTAGATSTVPGVPGAPTTAATPPGFERLLDPTDHLSVAVPAGWEAPVITNDDLTNELKTMAADDPAMAPLLNTALVALTQVNVGLFAVDTSSQTTLYAYGLVAPGVTSASQVPSSEVIQQVQATGATNVRYTPVQLPLGPAGQISAQLIVNNTTISEAFDYFSLEGRVVTIVLATRGTKAPISTLRRIDATLAPA